MHDAPSNATRPKRDHPDPKVLITAARVASCLSQVPGPPGLSPREAQFLPWLATDLGYAAIARQLGYGSHNARLIAKRLLRKIGVASRPAAVAKWLRPEAFNVSPPET